MSDYIAFRVAVLAAKFDKPVNGLCGACRRNLFVRAFVYVGPVFQVWEHLDVACVRSAHAASNHHNQQRTRCDLAIRGVQWRTRKSRERAAINQGNASERVISDLGMIWRPPHPKKARIITGYGRSQRTL